MSSLNSLWQIVVDASLHASVLIVSVLLLRLALRNRLPAQCFHLLWLLVAVRLLMPTAPATDWSVFNLLWGNPATADGAATIWQIRIGTLAGSPEAQSAAAAIAATPVKSDVPLSLALLWLGGVAIQVILLTRSAAQMRCRLLDDSRVASERVRTILARCADTAGLRHSPRLVVSAAVARPAVVGLWRPCLLLPPAFEQGLSEEELSFVLLHECTHLRRRDLPALWLMALVRAVHWFNPLVWVAVHFARTDVEMACDEAVLRRTDEQRLSDYGRALLKLAGSVAGGRPGLPAVGMVGGKRALQMRITRIAAYTAPNRLQALCSILTIAVVSVAFGANEKNPSQSATSGLRPTPVNLGPPSGGEQRQKIGPQVLIEAKLIELPTAQANRLVLPNGDQFLRVLSKRANESNRQGILNQSDATSLLGELTSQRGVDVLSAPQLITLSGERADIEIGREFRYVSEWDRKTKSDPWIADGFKTRRTGIHLTVTPVVKRGAEIDLRVEAEVVQFVRFVDYETGKPVPRGEWSSGKRRLRPAFSTRRCATSVTLPPGQSLVLLGLETEDRGFGTLKPPEKQLAVFMTARVIEPKITATRQ